MSIKKRPREWRGDSECRRRWACDGDRRWWEHDDRRWRWTVWTTLLLLLL